MKKHEDFAGVYLERHQVSIVLARSLAQENVAGMKGHIPLHELTHFQTIKIIAKSDPIKVLKRLSKIILENTDNLKGVGIACYGPFISLDFAAEDTGATQNGFGVLDKKTADPPFAGTDLYNVFQDALRSGGAVDVKIDIQTDAVAGALAEGHFRQLKSNELLVYILLTDGVGGGFVKGKTPLSSAYHSEMGLTPVQLTETDRRILGKSLARFGPSIGDLITGAQLVERAKALGENGGAIVGHGSGGMSLLRAA